MGTFNGTSGSDVLNGTNSDDEINGHGGADELNGLLGKDVINGGGGNDVIDGGGGEDIIQGGNGADEIDGGSQGDEIYGGAGNDIITDTGGGDSPDYIEAGGGHDTINAGAANDIVHGGVGNDIIDGGTNNDILHGDEGEDEIRGSGGLDILFGGENDDELFGGSHKDQLFGEGGSDALDGGSGADSLYGGSGADGLEGDGGNDTLDGGTGDDFVAGGAGDDTLFGGNTQTATELLTNGSLDAGNTGWTSNNPTGGMGANFNGATAVFNAQDEAVYGDSIEQTFSTTVGESHAVSLTVGETGGNVGDHTFQIDILDEDGNIVATETVVALDGTTEDVSFEFAATTENSTIRIINTASTNTVTSDGFVNNVSVQTIAGVSGNDELVGGAGNDTLDGGDGDDILYGDDQPVDAFISEVIASGGGESNAEFVEVTISASEDLPDYTLSFYNVDSADPTGTSPTLSADGASSYFNTSEVTLQDILALTGGVLPTEGSPVSVPSTVSGGLDLTISVDPDDPEYLVFTFPASLTASPQNNNSNHEVVTLTNTSTGEVLSAVDVGIDNSFGTISGGAADGASVTATGTANTQLDSNETATSGTATPGESNVVTSGVPGNDIIDGGNGTDTIYGGGGDDVITVGATDTATGGADDDDFILDFSQTFTDDGSNIITIDGSTSGSDFDEIIWDVD